MDQEAVVTRIEGKHAYVEVSGAGQGCGRCHESDGCQSGILTRLFRQETREYRIRNTIGARPGERVIVSVAAGTTLRAALLAYLVPVTLLLCGAFAGTALSGAADADSGALLGALSGLALGWVTAYAIRRTPAGEVMQPVLHGKTSTTCLKDACQ